MSDRSLTCQELVEIVTEYIEGGLVDAERRRFENHVAVCGGCANYLDQIRTTIAVAGHVTVDDLTEEARNGLLVAFRDGKRE